MINYLAGVCSSALSVIFIIFFVGAVGFLIGRITVKGVSFGTAGVLIAAILFGILCHYVNSFTIKDTTITLWNPETTKARFDFVSNIGTALFITAVGLIAGPKFFRMFNRKSVSYLLLGVIIIAVGGLTAVLFLLLDKNLSPEMAAGLLTGGLTSTPGFSAAKEAAAVALKDENEISAGYGIAYIYGVIGIVLFVQLVPKILKIDIAQEREHFVAANSVDIPEVKGNLIQFDEFGFFPFFLTIAFGCLIGAIKIPKINFSLGTSGGTLIAGLIIGHFGKVGRIDCRISKQTLNYMRELGLILFLIGAGVPGGVNFVQNVRISYFIYGAFMTTLPMVVGYIIARYVFKLNIFNNLGSITGGMTSTPALGTLIATTGTDEVSSAYAASYPLALVSVVLAAKIIVMAF